jgi:uncharacterized RDD family membrane protein YckC
MLSTQHDLSGLPDPQIDQQFYTGVPFKRLIAWLIDFVIIILISMALVMATFGVGAFAFPLLMLASNIGYRIYTLQRNSATLGMHLAGIEIRNGQGNKLTLEEAAWHTGIYTIIAISFFALIISMVMMLVNERGQGIHDYFVGTTAINRPKLS